MFLPSSITCGPQLKSTVSKLAVHQDSLLLLLLITYFVLIHAIMLRVRDLLAQ